MATAQMQQPLAENVNQLTTGLNRVVREFEDMKGPEALTALVGFLTPARERLVEGSRFMVGYTRRHPIRMAVSAVALGYLATRLLRSSAPKIEHLSDK